MAQLSGPETVHEAVSDPESSLEWTGPGLLDGSDLAAAPEVPRAPSTVVVFSPKGGAGTTFLAVNLAIALSERGRRRVCVVDLDLQFGDVAIVAGLSPNRGIADAVGQSLADDEILDGVLTMLSTGVDCVLAPIDPAAADEVSADLVAALLARLRERYEYVVVDTPSQLTEAVLEAFDVAEHNVLVTTPGLPALKNLRLMLDTLDLLGTSEAARTIVLNQVAEKSGLERADVEEILGRPVAAVIPAGPDVAASIDVGTPLLGRRRDTAVAAAVRAFVSQTFVGDPQPAGRRGLRLGPRTRKRSS